MYFRLILSLSRESANYWFSLGLSSTPAPCSNFQSRKSSRMESNSQTTMNLDRSTKNVFYVQGFGYLNGCCGVLKQLYPKLHLIEGWEHRCDSERSRVRFPASTLLNTKARDRDNQAGRYSIYTALLDVLWCLCTPSKWGILESNYRKAEVRTGERSEIQRYNISIYTAILSREETLFVFYRWGKLCPLTNL